MALEGQQILSEGFPLRSFTITWEPGMPRLKLDFQSRILSQEIIFLHTWSFLPFVTLQLHIWVKDHCIRQADQEQKIWSTIRFSSFAHENFVLGKRRVLRICLVITDDHLHSYCRYASRTTWIGIYVQSALKHGRSTFLFSTMGELVCRGQLWARAAEHPPMYS